MSQVKEKFLKDYIPPNYWIHTTDLTIDLYEDHALVTTTLGLERNSAHPAPNNKLVLNGEHLELISLRLNQTVLQPNDYTLTDIDLTLHNLPERSELEIITKTKPQENTALEGLYRSGSMFCTQCEAEGFRRISYYLDRPDVMATFTTRITADQKKYPVLLSNGNKIDSGPLDNGRHFAVWQDPFKKPSYLFALVAGDLDCLRDQFITRSDRKVALEIYTEHGKINECQHALESLKKSMRWDEERFNLEYDLDIYMIVAVSDFNMGAMENKGLNIFNTKYVLAQAETATDSDFLAVESVIGHEYFHNWTGNRVTCRDWFQLSLKEGLTVFRDQEFSSDLNTRAVKRIQDVNIIRSAQFAEDASPMAHPIRPESYIEMNNFYTVTVYDKGAEIIRMLHTLLGEQGFQAGIQLYFKRHDGQAVTCDDFVSAMEDANQRSLDQFKLWYGQAGTPTLHITDDYDEHTQRYTLRVKQNCPPTPGQAQKQPMHIPVKVGLLDAEGDALELNLSKECNNEYSPQQPNHRPLKELILNLQESEQEFHFDNISTKPIPSLLRDFSAPVKVHYPYSEDELCFLFKHDNNAFNRWDAGQTLFKRFILNAVDQLRANQTVIISDKLIQAFANILTSATLDAAFITEAVRIPTVQALAEEMPTIWVDELLEARKILVHTLAERLKPEFLAIYTQCHRIKAYSLSQKDIARRALQNICLSYLLELDDHPDHIRLAVDQFNQANNMTNQCAALAALSHTNQPERQQVLAAFYQQWQHHELVVNKWLMIQARSSAESTLTDVKALTQHTAFDIKTPNNVYALLVGFAANMKHFHAKDGSGYHFIEEKVQELSAINPQVAARLVRSLMNWRRYDEQRSKLMKASLESIANTPALCKDVYEIVSKALN
ncbi:aminopeptidase N [Piscirickettsia salmonis]|uniref:aminopeptidase N n=1 Tax=Piscirickettsia salmonis TaxID=1238 RepID=UPI000F07E1EC|nr:aminopeptidase N [Piscirickettsiaceae bacterium NZ-RLO2]